MQKAKPSLNGVVSTEKKRVGLQLGFTKENVSVERLATT
jgi:hypothetical protein